MRPQVPIRLAKRLLQPRERQRVVPRQQHAYRQPDPVLQQPVQRSQLVVESLDVRLSLQVQLRALP